MTSKKTEAISDASHAVTNSISAAKNPLGNATIEAFLKIDAAEFAAWNASAKTCNNASFIPKPKLSFAFQGSGLLLPFYSGVVQALQDRYALFLLFFCFRREELAKEVGGKSLSLFSTRPIFLLSPPPPKKKNEQKKRTIKKRNKKNRNVLTPAVSRSASFGGQSGGAITSVLTALGWPGLKQFKLFQETLVGVAICKAQFAPNQQQEAALQCSFNKIGLPLLAAAINATSPDAAAVINNRVTLCE